MAPNNRLTLRILQKNLERVIKLMDILKGAAIKHWDASSRAFSGRGTRYYAPYSMIMMLALHESARLSLKVKEDTWIHLFCLMFNKTQGELLLTLKEEEKNLYNMDYQHTQGGPEFLDLFVYLIRIQPD